MALPSPSLHPYHDTGGTDWIDENMSQESADWFDRTFPEAVGLGAGNQGVVYECIPGKACKITASDTEVGTARHLLKRPNPGCVKVYGIKRLQNKSGDKVALWLWRRLVRWTRWIERFGVLCGTT